MRKTKQLLAGTLGSVLLVGADQSWASSVARQCAANALKRGAVVYLVDSPSETSVARNGMQDYLTASGLKADLTNFHTLSNYRRFATGDDLGKALATLGVFRHQPTVCVIDNASTTNVLLPGMSMLRVAQELAQAAHCVVYVTGSYGSHPVMKPKLSDYKADAIWHVIAGANLEVFLENVLPMAGTIMKLKGRVGHASHIVFEPETKELADV